MSFSPVCLPHAVYTSTLFAALVTRGKDVQESTSYSYICNSASMTGFPDFFLSLLIPHRCMFAWSTYPFPSLL